MNEMRPSPAVFAVGNFCGRRERIAIPESALALIAAKRANAREAYHPLDGIAPMRGANVLAVAIRTNHGASASFWHESNSGNRNSGDSKYRVADGQHDEASFGFNLSRYCRLEFR